MYSAEHVPCSDGVHHTNFVYSLERTAEDEVVIGFMPHYNFTLADTEWRQNFTMQLTEECQSQIPGIRVVFSIN